MKKSTAINKLSTELWETIIKNNEVVGRDIKAIVWQYISMAVDAGCNMTFTEEDRYTVLAIKSGRKISRYKNVEEASSILGIVPSEIRKALSGEIPSGSVGGIKFETI